MSLRQLNRGNSLRPQTCNETKRQAIQHSMTLNRLNTSIRQLHHIYHISPSRSRSALTTTAWKTHLRTLHLSHRHLRVRPTRLTASQSPSPISTSTSTSISPPKHISTTAKMATQKEFKTRPETYEEALRRLSLLQSNKTIVNLFGGNDNSSAPDSKTKDLNAIAMPEMLAWLSRAGYTPASLTASGLRVVHVAGTKGKGSVSTLISSILTHYTGAEYTLPSGELRKLVGEKVGLYTSPHVLSVRERIQLNCEPISRELFTKYFFELWDRLSEAAREKGDLLPSSGSIQNSLGQQSTTSRDEKEEGLEEEDEYDGPATKPFYFRFLTLLAFHVFVREGVKSAVVECGIGGEYDPTNCLEPECVTASVITQLGIDHVSMLGDTLPKIAWHKAGIMKKGVKVFTRSLEVHEVMDVLRSRTGEKGAILQTVNDSEVEGWWDCTDVGRKIAQEAKLHGPFQKYNMTLAVKAAREHLIQMGVQLGGREEFMSNGRLEGIPDQFVAGLKKASLRGRCEVFVDREKLIEWFIDGAHTEDSLRGVGEWCAGYLIRDRCNYNEPWVLLFNQQDRDPAVLVRSLLAGVKGLGDKYNPTFTHAVFTRNEEKPPGEGESPRDLSVQEKARAAFIEVVGKDANVETWTMDSVAASIELIRGLAPKDTIWGKVLVTGSFHLVGAVLKTIDRVED